jgi:hypothetical protein
MSSERKTSLSFRCELSRELFEQEKDNAGPAEREGESAALGEGFGEQRAEVVSQ